MGNGDASVGALSLTFETWDFRGTGVEVDSVGVVVGVEEDNLSLRVGFFKMGVSIAGVGVAGWGLTLSLSFRPTLDVNGVSSVSPAGSSTCRDRLRPVCPGVVGSVRGTFSLRVSFGGPSVS